MPDPIVAPELSPDMIQTPDPGVLAAVQASLAETAAAQTPPVDTGEIDPAAAPAATPDPAADPATPPADPATPPADPSADPAAPPADPATPPADPATPPPAPRPSDEFGELPVTYKQETRDRFEAVKTKYDEVVARATNAETAASTWHETITSTGATPEQFGEVLTLLTDMNSKTPEGFRRAYETLTRQTAILGKALGLPAQGYDPLDDHPDLKARVEDSVDFTREDALAIAAGRATGKLTETTAARQTEQATQQQAYDAGVNRVAALGNSLRSSDVHFEAKLPFLTPIIETVIQHLPPDQWVAKIQEAYAKLPTPAAAAPAPTVPRTPNPIRPGGGGTLDKKPGSALEAVQFALARGG